MRSPRLSATLRKTAVKPKRLRIEPRKGMSNTSSAADTQIAIAHMPSTKFGTSLPMMNSMMPTGVANSASMVPRSHSRDTTSAVSKEPIIISISEIEPGTRKRRLSSSGLNQNRELDRDLSIARIVAAQRPLILP